MRSTGTTIGRAVLAGAAVAALAVGTAACGGSESGRFGMDQAPERGGDQAAPVRALTAAAESTEEITSADFHATTSAPAAAGGDVSVSGSISWEDEVAMELTVDGEQLGAAGGVAGMPAEVGVVWLDGVMYMDMGEAFADSFDGRSWMRMDLMGIVEETGDEDLADAMAHGMEQANQDPAEQVALLLQSPEIEHVGEETLDGAPVDHYRGTITVEDALANGAGGAGLSEAERQQLTDTMRELGVDAYELDIWVNEDDFPIRTLQSYDTADGPVESEVTYSNLGTDVTVAAPPADSVIDFMEILGSLESGMVSGF
ncbi:hypothetical protein ACTWP5_20355 [Streptomyces sp. 4N509B]|uniref:hypothetical protein n=1 Tax=Streptomyces sp. 4N509B TaxID=3457413 RepID=UPI003FD085C4